MTQPDDNLIRKQALDTRHSYAVSAPAGSGKTGLLTQRFLALLGQCEQPENILAITFTKKAAAEMQHRIISALVATEQALKENAAPPAAEYDRNTWNLARTVLQRDKERSWQLLSLPNRLRITTIDSFCRTLSQQAPLVNGMGNVPEMLDTADAEQAYLLAIRETIKSIEELEHREDLTRLINHFNNNHRVIEKLLLNLLKRRDQWLPSLLSTRNQRQVLEENLQFTINEELEKLRVQLGSFGGELIDLADFAASQLIKEGKDSAIVYCLGIDCLPENNSQGIKKWEGLIELVLTSANQFRKSINKSIGFPAKDTKADKETNAFNDARKKRMQSLLHAMSEDESLLKQLLLCRHLPEPQYDDKQWQLLDSLSRILLVLTARLSIVFQQLGKTDYIAVTQAALNALGDEDNPSDLALLLDYRIHHILIDEFQDTSLPQLTLLQKLVSGWQPDDNKSLFVVGDAMQSCYGFRDANVGIFLALRQYGIGALEINALDLTVNFRSQSPIVEWCNTVFSQLFPARDMINDGAVKYRPAIAVKSPSLLQHAKHAVETHIIASEERLQHREHEATLIADTIFLEQTHSPKQSIAILVRNRGQVKALSDALQQKGIRYRATELDRLDTNMLVQDLLSLTRALLYPHDTLAWFALLRAPWCGLDMKDLYYVSLEKKNSSQPGKHHQTQKQTQKQTLIDLLLNHRETINLSTDGSQILNRFCSIIEVSFKQQGRYTLAEWIERTYLALGGDALFVDADDELAVDGFFSCLKQYQLGADIQNWDIFTSAISKLYKKNARHATDPTEDLNNHLHASPVEIMTIHKSKGLEFDTVFIPGIDGTLRADEKELIAWMDYLDHQQNARLLISPVHGSEDEKDPVYDFIRLQQKHKQAFEADRLFYVGCTRAIKQLYLFAQSTVDKKTGDISIGNKDHLLSRLWPIVKDQAQIHEIATDQQNDDSEKTQHPNYIIRLGANWRCLNGKDNQILKHYRLDKTYTGDNDDNIADDQVLQQRQHRYFGHVLHSALEQIAYTGIDTWSSERLQQSLPLWTLKLQELGMNKKLAQDRALEINQCLQPLLESQLALWLFNAQHKDSHSEYTLWSASESKTHSGFNESIIDRTFIDAEDNTRWIIDYKSSKPADDESLEAFLTEEVGRYTDQLLRYKRLFKHQPEQIRCALYFPLIDHLHEVSP